MASKYAEKHQAKTGSLDCDQNPLDAATDEDGLRMMELELAILQKKRALAQKSSASSSALPMTVQPPIAPLAVAQAPPPPPKRNCVARVVTMQSIARRSTPDVAMQSVAGHSM